MGKAELLINRSQIFKAKYLVSIKVYEVAVSEKFPKGIKAKFVVVDLESREPILLIDNHEPFGYHVHSALPHDKSFREILDVSDHLEALAIFEKMLKEI